MMDHGRYHDLASFRLNLLVDRDFDRGLIKAGIIPSLMVFILLA